MRPPAVAALALTFLAAVLGTACRSAAGGATGPYAPAEEVKRNTALAEKLTAEAVALVHEDPDRAERLLREALSADLFHGPAHNNLGVLYLKKGKLYEAASEFEWARKLLPGHPDPRLNLALALEAAGKSDDAVAAYAAALEVHPGYVPAIQGLARLTLRAGRKDGRIASWLERIVFEGESEEWRAWARRERALRGGVLSEGRE